MVRTEAQTRARIRAAAIEVIGTVGFKAATVEQITAAAGVEVAEFERHFADIERCYVEIYDELGEEFLAMAGEAFMNARSEWLDQMRVTAYTVFDYFREDPARARFTAVEPMEVGDLVMAKLDSNMDMLVELVHAGRFALPDPESVPRSTAEAAVGSIWKMLVTKIRNKELGDDEAVGQLMYIATAPYLGEEAAQQELARRR